MYRDVSPHALVLASTPTANINDCGFLYLRGSNAYTTASYASFNPDFLDAAGTESDQHLHRFILMAYGNSNDSEENVMDRRYSALIIQIIVLSCQTLLAPTLDLMILVIKSVKRVYYLLKA